MARMKALKHVVSACQILLAAWRPRGSLPCKHGPVYIKVSATPDLFFHYVFTMVGVMSSLLAYWGELRV